MRQRFGFILLGMGALVLLSGTGLHAQTNLLTNGDFEDLTGWEPASGDHTTAPLGWRDDPDRANAANQQSGANAIGGSGTSANLLRTGFAGPGSTSGGIRQHLEQQSGPVYEWSFDFATEDPGGAGQRSLSLALRHGNYTTTAIMRVNDDFDDGIGDFQVFSGGSWQTILPYSVYFDDDVTMNPLVHHFSMTVDSTQEVPSYDLRITDSNGTVHEALGSTLFNGDDLGPVNEGGIGIEFINQQSTINRGILVDNVSLVSLVDFPTAPGDFDNDGDVDGSDFLAWQRGESPDPFSATDLSAWEAEFGAAAELSGAIRAVPEPTAGVLLVLGSLLLVARRRC